MPQSTRLYTAGHAGATQARRVAINTQGSTQQGVASLPALQSFTTTAETQFTDPGLANAYPLALAIPPGGPCEQEEFDLVFSGYVTTTQSATVIFKLYLGDSATIGSNTIIATSTTSAAIATTTVPFAFKATLVYDSISGKLTGRFSGIVGATATALAAITGAPIAGSLSNTANPVATFTLTATFSAATTANVVNLKDFGINH
jgi:hypothetical protein